MTKGQIEKLKLLGYVDTQEDGATLQHNSLRGMSSYVWKGDKFDDILRAYSWNLEYALRLKIASSVRQMKGCI